MEAPPDVPRNEFPGLDATKSPAEVRISSSHLENY